jgi:hypothetical protein
MMKKAIIAALALSTLGIGPAVSAANAWGPVIRSGGQCYWNIGSDSFPFLIPMPCPNEVSGE